MTLALGDRVQCLDQARTWGKAGGVGVDVPVGGRTGTVIDVPYDARNDVVFVRFDGKYALGPFYAWLTAEHVRKL